MKVAVFILLPRLQFLTNDYCIQTCRLEAIYILQSHEMQMRRYVLSQSVGRKAPEVPGLRETMELLSVQVNMAPFP
jgi:hypothetical protein